MKKSIEQTIKDCSNAMRQGIVEDLLRWALVSDGWKPARADQIIRWSKVYVEKTKGQRGPCQVFNRDESFRGSGIYKMSFDWHNDNQLCHLIEENGSLILWPSHKVIFSSNKHDTLPGYKKLHKEWKL
jgi:hypothetical protein